MEGLLALLLAGPPALFYAFIFEPIAMLRIRHWRISRAEWPVSMRIAILSDLHLGEPFVGRLRLRRVVEKANTLNADLIVILGDLTPGHTYVTSVPEAENAESLSHLDAPLGVISVLGNHDWWEDKETQERGTGQPRMAHELKAHGIPVLENDVIALPNGIQIAGLGDQLAFESKDGNHRGVDDLPKRARARGIFRIALPFGKDETNRVVGRGFSQRSATRCVHHIVRRRHDRRRRSLRVEVVA